MSADLIILPYEESNQFMYAIYDLKKEQYLTLYSTKEKAQNDLDYILEDTMVLGRIKNVDTYGTRKD